MCGIQKCSICGMMKEMCGKVCHGFCQWYNWKYAKIHHKDPRTSKLDGDLFQIAGGTF